MAAGDFDRTHLGAKGAAFFAGMVAKELVDAVPSLAMHLRSRPQLSEAQARDYAYREVLKPWDPLSDPLATGAALTPDYVVDPAAKPDGRTTFDTVQAAVIAAIVHGGRARRYILVKPGTYRELLNVPDADTPITLYGTSDDAAATRITEVLPASVAGSTPASAVTKIRNHGFQAKNITFENAFNKERGDWIAEADERTVQRQAVALMVDGADRVQFENVRFIGFQDTLYLRGATARSFFHKSYVEGDMDFIFGDATAYFHRSEIKSLGDRRVSYLLAPSTHAKTRFGFVFNECRFTHDGSPNALTGTFKLARQWFQGRNPAAVGKTVILHSRIGAHIDRSQPWADWGIGTPNYRAVQYDADGEPYLAEYRNTED
jgi:polygalacturonase